MEKAFDTKALTAQLKEQGLDIAEESAKTLFLTVFNWTEQSLNIHPNPYLKFLIPLLAQVKQPALDGIDKIDGKVG